MDLVLNQIIGGGGKGGRISMIYIIRGGLSILVGLAVSIYVSHEFSVNVEKCMEVHQQLKREKLFSPFPHKKNGDLT